MDDLGHARYAELRWNAPLSDEHAATLVDRLDLQVADSVLDLGCGWAELLIRALERAGPGCSGVGVDTDEQLLVRGRAQAGERGVDGQLQLINAPAERWSEPADRVLAIGVTHVWGGTVAALQKLPALVRPGGRLLLGDGYWEREPSEAARATFGEQILSLTALVTEVLSAGWRVLHQSSADQREWDEFESAWRGGLERWLERNPTAADRPRVQDELSTRLLEYVRDYRGVLGFCYLVLSRDA